jgi:hypothetical protein
MFNPADFMNTSTETVLETSYTPVPENEYTAVVKSVEAVTLGERQLPALQVKYLIDDTSVRELTGMEEVLVSQTIWLDIDENTGLLSAGKNKNIKLGKLREAVGQNDGRPWMPSMLEGQVVKIQVKHSVNPNSGAINANVTQTTSA